MEKDYITRSRGTSPATARILFVTDRPEVVAATDDALIREMGVDRELLAGPRLMDDDAHPEHLLRLWRWADRTDPRRRPVIEVRNRRIVDRFGVGCCNPPAEQPLPDGLERGAPNRRPYFLELRPVAVGLYERPRTWSTDHPRVIKDFIEAVLDADLATPAEAEVLETLPGEIDRALELEIDDAKATRVAEEARKRSDEADEAVSKAEWMFKELRRDATAARTRYREKATATVKPPREKLAELEAEAEAAEARVEPAEKHVEQAKLEAARALSDLVKANEALKAREAID